jgi:NodT family efflux transporter outer membrane factor (OMF) lipoprotein
MSGRARAPDLLVALFVLGGCMMVGPDYVRPPAPLSEAWHPQEGVAISHGAEPVSEWWEAFADPILGDLVAQAYRRNPSLRAAGVRVLEAQARRGIAIGTLFPQTQQAIGAYTRARLSENRANPVPDTTFNDLLLGFDAAWELDIWGRFRRGIEAADAELLASIASYDDVLVSLLAEVAANYVTIRTLEEQIAVARHNAEIQKLSFGIAETRFSEGAVTQLDPAQAGTILYDTESQIPRLEADILATASVLSVLLGMPPHDLRALLGDEYPGIPRPPATVAVGIPADLLRRRPDVRRAERVLAAQSAQIGVAKADLFPHFSLVGTLGFHAEDVHNFFEGDSFEGFGGPTFQWAILNYGRITNSVRVQDARYQALVADYENTVLRAQAEVESAIATYLGALRRTALLEKSVDSAAKALEVVTSQYHEGAADFTAVLLSEDFLVNEQNLLVASRGEIAFNLIALYKALGGGWELREGRSFVSEETAREMRARTNWGSLLSEREQAKDTEAARRGTEGERGWFRWRWWWPKW